MRKGCAVIGLAIAILSANPASALNDDDYAAMMGTLWRLREPICPRLAFDPEAFVKALRLPGGAADVVRRHYRHAFDRGYAAAGEVLAKGTPAFCAFIEQFFDGKHDFWGNLTNPSGAPAPGLTIR